MGIIFDKYRNGINLGGWISQCSYEKRHILEFITEADVKKIASWGLDHIRLPFDYHVLENGTGYEAMDNCLKWCKNAGLNLVLDLHKAPGYSFGNNAEDNILFSDGVSQDKFVNIWQDVAARYKNEGDSLIFELLNEVVDAQGDAWNKVARKAIEAILAISPTRYILLGGPNYNSVHGLETLEIWNTEYVLYNFHFYEPMFVTHQNARWTALKDSGIFQPYPGKIEGFAQLEQIFAEGSQYPHMKENTVFDINFLEQCLSPAIEFSKRHNKELYCGEYGVLELAGLQGRINYTKDTNALFEKYGIGRALWTYKDMDFTTVGKDGEAVSGEIIEAIRRK
ncbi:MAG: glycoside hydrolase family 5 protein [Defluviitaleaceae bacterium]|nr:glycoside hydrolase family 5 protein [Defluviitaleaceae bacterium]